MKITKTTLLVLSTLVVGMAGCVPQSEHDEVVAELEAVKKELDEVLNGKNRLTLKLNQAINDENWQEANGFVNELIARHSHNLEDVPLEQLTKTIKEGLDEQRRIANLNNTGMWDIKHYVDEFGDPTGSGYITNTAPITGTFSNSATTNSDLTVKFAIEGLDAHDLKDGNFMAIMLFEYGRNHPVKKYSSIVDSYSIRVKAGSGEILKLFGTNYNDRIFLEAHREEDWNTFIDVLLNGGPISFYIARIEGRSTYSFELEDASWLGNALELLDRAKVKESTL